MYDDQRARYVFLSPVSFSRLLTSHPVTGQLAGASLDSAIFKAAGNNWLAMQLFAGAVQTMGGLLSVWLVVRYVFDLVRRRV